MSEDVKYPEPIERTLVYIESCVVDKGGRLESRKMNDGDFANIEDLEEEGILKVERMKMETIEDKQISNWKPTHKVTKFTDEAWTKAHEARKDRGKVLD